METLHHPLIALPCGRMTGRDHLENFAIKEAYVTALQAAGAQPVILPVSLPLASIDTLLDKFDGFLLSGGGDIDPSLFNGQPSERVYGIESQRDLFEIVLTKGMIEAKKPFFAICRGVQVLNVAMGGELYTDIASQVPNALKHDWFPGYPREQISHRVSLETGSQCQHIIGMDDIGTNSLHHQAISKLGEGLRVNAVAEDGIIEGVELLDHPFGIGVQWHPEWLQSDYRMMRLFEAFVEACKD